MSRQESPNTFGSQVRSVLGYNSHDQSVVHNFAREIYQRINHRSDVLASSSNKKADLVHLVLSNNL